MTARKNTSDRADMFGHSPVEEAPDGGMSRGDYNRAVGRKSDAPLSGGSREAAYAALVRPSAKQIPSAFIR